MRFIGAVLAIAVIVSIATISALHIASPSHAEPAIIPTASTHDWKMYYNARFSYAACYPADIFTPQGEALNADGQRFLANDGAEILVFGSNNVFNQSISDALKDAINSFGQTSSSSVTHKASQDNWFSISGSRNNQKFFEKTFLTKNQFKTVEILYNKNTRNKYDGLTSKIISCFTAN